MKSDNGQIGDVYVQHELDCTGLALLKTEERKALQLMDSGQCCCKNIVWWAYGLDGWEKINFEEIERLNK
jgi:hypothetical protein